MVSRQLGESEADWTGNLLGAIQALDYVPARDESVGPGGYKTGT